MTCATGIRPVVAPAGMIGGGIHAILGILSFLGLFGAVLGAVLSHNPRWRLLSGRTRLLRGA